jgi:exonuclease SbcC
MLPVRLTLRNFLPYRAPDPITFEGLHLAVLSGPNGAGKSSLLDAITWALWGKARSKSDVELITLGTDETRVELDFEQENTRYRVVRQRNRKRRQGSLNLFVYDPDAGQYTDISGSSIPETQARINHLLRLDYDTFVHSAFLQQGQADAFTTSGPANRKKTLGNILGLEAWKQYESRARQRLTDIGTTLTNIDGRLTEIEAELAREPVLKRDLAEAEIAYEEAQQQLAEAEARYEAIQDAPSQRRAAADRLADLTRRLNEHTRDIADAEADAERQQARIADFEAIIAQRDAIEDGFATLTAAREADQSLSDKLLNMQDATRRRHELEAQIAAAKAALEAQASDHRGAIDELTRLTANGDTLTTELADIEGQIGALEAANTQRTALQDEIAALKEEAASLRSTNTALRAEMNAIKQRMETLGSADPDAALCPTCQQPLSPQQRADLLAEYQAEGTTRGDEYRTNATRLEAINGDIQAKTTDAKALMDQAAALNPLQQRAGELRGQLAAARDADTRLTEARAALHSVETALAAENYAGEARAQLAALQDEIAGLGYDRSAHDEAREHLTAYQTYESRHQELSIALAALPEAQQTLTATANRLDRLRRAHAEDSQAHTAMTAEVERLAALVAEANRRFDEAQRRRTAFQTAGEKRARAEQALHALSTARQRQTRLEQQRADLLAQQGVYEQLKDAFGKKGIPAMIIEAALPEIEDTANDLLTRMTGGRMRVHFAMQRETVKGDTVETLDIAIEDEAGLRDYALYSGGEAFRINFAIRIALSKLLARRAGAQLRTLFIDEGFGTQDAAGRERLIEAINVVADDFDLILTITHIDELRDAFPARLEIEKTPSGSRIRLA